MARVLIVDDAPTVRKYHKKIAKEMGLEVDTAINGIEALEKVIQNKFDLILVDINMPKMDGYQFVRELRKTPDVMDIPVVMISTESQEQDEHKAYQAGANFYLIKPVSSDILKTIINCMS